MDLRDGHLLCARDQMGLRVLHYHLSSTRFAVATDPDALFALSWMPRICNKDKIGDTLVLRGFNGETTYYHDIFRVLPGPSSECAAQASRKTQFWNPENIADVRFKSDHEYVEAFAERLQAAVKVRLRSRRAPCATITGGLTHPAFLSSRPTCSQQTATSWTRSQRCQRPDSARKQPVECYFDETPYVRQIAEFNGNISPHFIAPSKAPSSNTSLRRSGWEVSPVPAF